MTLPWNATAPRSHRAAFSTVRPPRQQDASNWILKPQMPRAVAWDARLILIFGVPASIRWKAYLPLPIQLFGLFRVASTVCAKPSGPPGSCTPSSISIVYVKSWPAPKRSVAPGITTQVPLPRSVNGPPAGSSADALASAYFSLAAGFGTSGSGSVVVGATVVVACAGWEGVLADRDPI